MKAIAFFCLSLLAALPVQAGTPAPEKQIAARIMSHLMYPSQKHDGEARYSVALGVKGDVLHVRKTQSSGVPAYDAAIESAIWKSSPIAIMIRQDGSRVLDLDLVFNMKDVP